MKLTATFAACALALTLTTTSAQALVNAVRSAPTPPPSTDQSQWFTTPDGCAYSRAKAPGYAAQWILILNPHHLGMGPAPRHCEPSLRAGN